MVRSGHPGAGSIPVDGLAWHLHTREFRMCTVASTGVALSEAADLVVDVVRRDLDHLGTPRLGS